MPFVTRHDSDDDIDEPADDYERRRWPRMEPQQIIVKTESSGKHVIYDGLIVAAIIALIGAVITLMLSVNTLQSNDRFQDQRIDKMERGTPK